MHTSKADMMEFLKNLEGWTEDACCATFALIWHQVELLQSQARVGSRFNSVANLFLMNLQTFLKTFALLWAIECSLIGKHANLIHLKLDVELSVQKVKGWYFLNPL